MAARGRYKDLAASQPAYAGGGALIIFASVETHDLVESAYSCANALATSGEAASRSISLLRRFSVGGGWLMV